MQELISNGKWKMDLLQNIFNKEDCARIGSIPLSTCDSKDRFVWPRSNSGKYTIKSGYVLAKEMSSRKGDTQVGGGNSSRNKANSGVWKFLWGLNIKHKLKHFIWKCLRGILPVNEVLKRRTGKADDKCVGCGEQTETLEHMLFFFARMLNSYGKLLLLGGMVCRISDTISGIGGMWKARNGVQFNREKRCPGQTINKAVQEWFEYRNINSEADRSKGTGDGTAMVGGKWTPPPKGFISMNTDVSLNMQERKVGWGIVARNDDCVLVGAWAVSENRLGDPVVEEATAIRKALIVAKQNGWGKIVLQLDCKTIVDKLNAKSAEHLSVGVILFDILKLRMDFVECSFSFIRRGENSVAHHLAKFALHLVDENVWQESFPDWLSSLASKDAGARTPAL
ncbi:uncharacterized protein [Coffea arabica]|uniref:RNase H type-1 domain-containing protein n=1 Tax=Coffea arabica TaxID=13443 RepID=A0A6P6TWB8_COFAR|nr:uncharacterized protein LOC113704980 [Coffea arabica]